MIRTLFPIAAAALLAVPANAQSFKEIKERGVAFGFFTAGFCAVQNGELTPKQFVEFGEAQNYSKSTLKWLDHPTTAEMATTVALEYDCDLKAMERAFRNGAAKDLFTLRQFRHMGWKF